MQPDQVVNSPWLRRFFCLIVCLFPAMPPAHGDKAGKESPVEKTGEQPLRIEMKSTSSGGGEVLGVIRISQRATGVVIEPALEGLEPGLHGLHIHESDSCESGPTDTSDTDSPTVESAKEAGDHWDPGLTGNHGGPWADGHRGDLPNLFVDASGTATTHVYAPRVTSRDFENRALVLHSEHDNYSDEPDSTGGSGGAIACGVAEG